MLHDDWQNIDLARKALLEVIGLRAAMFEDDSEYVFAYNLWMDKYAITVVDCLAILQSPIVADWQPVETAPKGERISVWTGENEYVAEWVKCPVTDDEAFCIARVDGETSLIVYPTHWAPTREPPIVAAPEKVE